MTSAKFQIGKNGITQGVIASLLSAFKNNKVVRISLLRASGRDREKKRNFAEEIIKRLKEISSNSFKYNIIGFTIVIKRYAN